MEINQLLQLVSSNRLTALPTIGKPFSTAPIDCLSAVVHFGTLHK